MPPMSTLNPLLVQDMVRHWLETPVNGYLGSDYGQDLKRVLHSPLASQLADKQLEKLRADVRVLGLLPPDAVNLYSTHDGVDKARLFVEIAGRALPFKG